MIPHTHVSHCCQYADVIPVHGLPTGQDRGEGVAVLDRSEGGMSQGGELVVIRSRVEGQGGVSLTDVYLVWTGRPSTPFFLGVTPSLAENLAIHYFNCTQNSNGHL